MISANNPPARSDSFYTAVSGERLAEQSAPIRTAWLIEKLASERGWPEGELLGSESDLRGRLGVGREALREAISVLANRGVIEVRRGRNGGIQVLSSDLARTASAVTAYLHATGISARQLAHCVAGLDLLLAYRLAQRPAELPARRQGEPVRRWLARACDHPVYLLYIEVLDSLISCGPGDGPVPHGLIGAIERQDPGMIAASLGAIPSSGIRGHESSLACSAGVRAFAIAQEMLENASERGETYLGNELSLCEEFAASRSVIRQALRILQDLDVVQARLGRSGGYEIKRPRPIGVIRQVYAWLAACRLCPLALVDLVWDLNAANVRLAGAALDAMPGDERERHFAALDKILGEEDDAERFVNLQKRMAEIAASPLVDIFARSIVSYQALQRDGQDESSPPLSFLDQERSIVAALRAGDMPAAESSIRIMQARLLEVLQDMPRPPAGVMPEGGHGPAPTQAVEDLAGRRADTSPLRRRRAG
ncbi:DNA-binding FadR family transcriptional regulator [Altererythrobacter atlanticus]|uniref:Transcriptional regulator NanR n=1 Tax=Croceibacterium atlanticum TaxID=1267766 RepID=A0A0F7KRL8_9SPHN|nr:GntR family transcriptional regulator [Croceibacterium atlanticum]AKH41395.1 transcriptional regulator NanR [Croceibacterium atlanticum]MBB5732857.1 DNA-binding FadR family transcriptional regulator [Croceibacterium atlanticum]